MTWGKKLVEWTKTAEEAFDLLVHLNHRYALDGRDPASYGGIRWCFGAFDRPFAPEASIVGQVRPRPTSVHRERLDVDVYAAWVSRSPFARSPRVAVIGSGMAGLAAARVLQNHGVDVSVFDKGRRAGGRVVSRQLLGVPFDYGAQYFTAHSETFANLVGALKWEGVLAEWNPRILREGKRVQVTLEPSAWFVAPHGFSTFAARLAEGLHVSQSKHVTCIERIGDACCVAFADGTSEVFDEVLVTVPGPQQSLLVPEAPVGSAYSPCWSLSLAFAGKLDLPFDVAVLEHGALAWVSRDSSKPGRENANTDVWTLHASTEFSLRHLESEPAEVALLLTEAFASLLQEHSVAMPAPLKHHVHKWRFARSQKRERLAYARVSGVGFAGDAFGGPRVESAYLSGVALAGDLVRRLTAEGAGVRHA